MTKAQVEKSPAIDTDRPVSRQQEIEYYRYCGYPSYWSGPYLWGGYPFPVTSPGRATTLEQERRWEWGAGENAHPHLRSSAAVIGYHIAAADGDIGHVEDFLVDDETWSIRHMVVDARNWWFGTRVLVSSDWITSVDWNASLLHVDLTCEEIKNIPKYDPSGPDYEARLHDHYGRPGYWKLWRDKAPLKPRYQMTPAQSHYEEWLDGRFDWHDRSVCYRAGGRVLAMASFSRDWEMFEAELAIEQEVGP